MSEMGYELRLSHVQAESDLHPITDIGLYITAHLTRIQAGATSTMELPDDAF